MKSSITKRQRALLDEIAIKLADNDDRLAVGPAFKRFDKAVKRGKQSEINSQFKRLFLQAANDTTLRTELVALLGSWGDTLPDEDIYDYVVTARGDIWLEIFAPKERRRRDWATGVAQND